ncbi:MAG: type II toxin-antitoxin system PemK/MazF family toxin [Planctomycetes bacterium]|nr:type II toxin-antitoxin system PemK/MazF family toxin [Planctomycetota bacterium]
MKKKRPCVVISPDLINHNSRAVLMAAISECNE